MMFYILMFDCFRLYDQCFIFCFLIVQAVQSVFYILLFDCFRLYDQCFIFCCLIVSGCTISVLYFAVWLFQAVQSVFYILLFGCFRLYNQCWTRVCRTLSRNCTQRYSRNQLISQNHLLIKWTIPFLYNSNLPLLLGETVLI